MASMSAETIDRVMIVGVGWVGRQIAARLAQHGVQVWLFDRRPEISQAALGWIHSIANDAIDSSSPHVATAGDWITRVAIADKLDVPVQLVIESVPEQISLKKRVLREISELQPAPTIIASNSSYFTPSVLCRFVTSPERYLHFHFHYPVTRETIADIVGCEHTLPELLDRVDRLATRIGQPALRLKREHPGYVYNWLLQSVLKSALELVAQGVVEPHEVDRSWKAVSGMPLGPFAIMDLIGLDVIEQVLSNARWSDSKNDVGLDQLIEVLAAPINQGHLGVKTKHGFYEY
jgi:3-hydroxyacyl-CoA dehydrogenase